MKTHIWKIHVGTDLLFCPYGSDLRAPPDKRALSFCRSRTHRSRWPRRRLSCAKASRAWPASISSGNTSTDSYPFADPSPVADQAHGPEEIPLDHEAIEVPDPLLRVDPVQDEVMLDWRAELVRHQEVVPLRNEASSSPFRMLISCRSSIAGSPAR